jgi:hypothetical protein
MQIRKRHEVMGSRLADIDEKALILLRLINR